MSSNVPRRSVRFNVLLQVAAAAVLLGAVNYFSFNNYGRWDFSRAQKFVLSDQTKQVIKDLKPAMNITVFASRTPGTPFSPVYQDLSSLLRELIFSARNFSGKKRIEVEYVDPARELTRAIDLQTKYKISAQENLVILDYQGQTKLIPFADLADFDMTPAMTGGQPKLIAFKGEQALTNGMISLLKPGSKKIYFLQGHGEPSIQGLTQLSVFRDYLSRQNATISPLSLASVDVIPADCALLIEIAPQTDLDDREATVIQNYWMGKGTRMMVLLDPRYKTSHWNSILGGIGIFPVDDRVLRIFPTGGTTFVLKDVTAQFVPGNAVSKRLVGLEMFLPGATCSLDLKIKEAKAADVQIWPIIQAAEAYWGEMDYVVDPNKGVRYDDGRDIGQPVYVAAAAARGGVSDDRVAVESSKLVVVANAQFAMDADLKETGMDFLLSSSSWLLDRGNFTGVMPKNIQNFTFKLSDRELGLVVLYTMIVLPGVIALLGFIVWLRRRA